MQVHWDTIYSAIVVVQLVEFDGIRPVLIH